MNGTKMKIDQNFLRMQQIGNCKLRMCKPPNVMKGLCLIRYQSCQTFCEIFYGAKTFLLQFFGR